MGIELLGIQEVAALMGVSRQRVWKRQKDGTLPKPYALVGGKRPVWTREQIEEWFVYENNLKKLKLSLK